MRHLLHVELLRSSWLTYKLLILYERSCTLRSLCSGTAVEEMVSRLFVELFLRVAICSGFSLLRGSEPTCHLQLAAPHAHDFP